MKLPSDRHMGQLRFIIARQSLHADKWPHFLFAYIAALFKHILHCLKDPYYNFYFFILLNCSFSYMSSSSFFDN